MIFSYNNFLLEKSTLTSLGVPKPVMQNIQKDYALKPTSEWIQHFYKKEIKDILIKNENNLVLQIGKDSIKVLVSVFIKGKKLYYIDKYMKKVGEWGEYWDKLPREGSTLTSILHEVEMENKQYILKNSDFSIVKSDVRKLEKEEKEFDEFSKKFREDLLNYFTVLLKNSYTSVAAKIEKTIVNNLAKVHDNLTPSQIKNILYQNVDKAKKSKDLQKKSKDIDKYHLDSDMQQMNSLTIFDEYLIEFEEAYSKKFHKYYNIKSLVDDFSRPKIYTAFIYYLYTGFLMDLYSYKSVSVLDDLYEVEDMLENDF